MIRGFNFDYDSLLQNATDIITKCKTYFITKCDRSILQNASGFLLQNATVYYKMRQLLQNATFITNFDSRYHNISANLMLTSHFLDQVH